MRRYWGVGALGFAVGCVAAVTARGDGESFVNWESPHVHPMDLTSDGRWLLAVNTADARLEVFDLSSGWPVHAGSVSVGLDPVSVRSRGNAEAWVVNHISDSVSVVDLASLSVVDTLPTADEPADVVFAGTPERAYVSCSQVNQVQVFNPLERGGPLSVIDIDGEEPRALAVGPDGSRVFVAIFESGNASTVLKGGEDRRVDFQNTVSDPRGPWGGQNPPPNAGSDFNPPINPALPPPLPVSLIVKKSATNRWLDDNQGDWTELVSGSLARVSDRPSGWDMPDYDVAMIETASQQVQYVSGLMNLCMALAVNPATGRVAAVGTDATNHIRFEPILNGRFLRVNVALFDPVSPLPSIRDLNPHLDYSASTVPQSERDRSIGDPRAVVWNASGTRGYIAGMGSNNIALIDADGSREQLIETIDVGAGPTGLALDEGHGRLYVLNRFEATVSVVDTDAVLELGRVVLFDPTPEAIKLGRRHLYNTRETSGLGHVSCASCHVDARVDGLAWDLGDPSGELAPFDQNCFAGIFDELGDGTCDDWHPMKGPMTTQTLQDIVGKEPFHWRGDRDGLEEFNGAFQSLLGDDETLSPAQMQEFEDFLATIRFPPNPFRNLDNSLSTDVPLTDHVSVGRFSPEGTPLPPGNAVRGLDAFRNDRLDRPADCVSCHTLATGVGTNLFLEGGAFEPFPTGANGELHHAVRPLGDTNFKIPQLRSLPDKRGFDRLGLRSRAGFGLLHDGTVDSLVRFLSLRAFGLVSDQHIADVIAFLLSFSGSDLPTGSTDQPLELLGPSSQDTHAAVGAQVTLNAENLADPVTMQRLDSLLALADTGRVGLVAKGRRSGVTRGWDYLGEGIFQSDRAAEQATSEALRATAGAGTETTFTVVVEGTQHRIGIDRDEDGHLDRDEIDGCSNPADPSSTPLTVEITGDANANGHLDLDDFVELTGCLTGPGAAAEVECRCSFDLFRDGEVSLTDFAEFQVDYVGE